MSISKRNDNVIYEIGLDDKGEVESAKYINYNGNSISFQRKNGELTETFRTGAQNSEEALREMAQAFLEETGEALRFPGTEPLAVDVQYRRGELVTLTDVKGDDLTVRLSDEKDRNVKPYVLTSDGNLSYGVIPGGLVPEEPKTKGVRLSLGSDVEMKGAYRYGLVHIMEDHYTQLKKLGFETVEEFIKHVLSNIGGAVLEKYMKGRQLILSSECFSPQSLIQIEKKTDLLIVEMSDGSDHWDIINLWRAENRYIEKKKKEAEAAVPAIGLPHATNVAEGYQNGTTEGNPPLLVRFIC